MARYRRKKNFFEGMSLTNFIIILNVIVFFFVTIGALIAVSAGVKVEKFISFVALNPELFMKGYFWTILTSMFTHINFSHLLVNMISLFFIGMFVERLIGRKRYMWFYLISGLVASLAFVFFAYLGLYVPNGKALFGGIDDFAVGASGAIFGLAGLLAVLLPRLKVLLFFIIPMPMWIAMAVLIFGVWIFSIYAGLPVGNTAHLGGLIVGLIYGAYLRTKYSKKVALLNRMFSQ